MNAKAEKFAKMLSDNEINCFSKEELKDDLNTVLFRSSMDIEGQRLPVVVIIDDSIYVICRTLIAGKCITDVNRSETFELINSFNSNYKTFKYFATEAGEVIMDICLPATNETFEPNIIRVLIDLSVKNLEENYRPLMQKIWGNPVNKIAEA
jgi:hypothetical protein